MSKAIELVICPVHKTCADFKKRPEIAPAFHCVPHIRETSCKIETTCPACEPANIEKLTDSNLAIAYRAAVDHAHATIAERGNVWPCAVLLGEIVMERKTRKHKAKKGE